MFISVILSLVIPKLRNCIRCTVSTTIIFNSLNYIHGLLQTVKVALGRLISSIGISSSPPFKIPFHILLELMSEFFGREIWIRGMGTPSIRFQSFSLRIFVCAYWTFRCWRRCTTVRWIPAWRTRGGIDFSWGTSFWVSQEVRRECSSRRNKR